MLYPSNARPSLANELTQQLREEILTGERKPGEYLRLQRLSDEFEISLSPIRESLSVLCNEGLAVQVGQRGYRVAPLLRGQLLDATRARLALEIMCLRISIEENSAEWQEGLVSSFWRLEKIGQQSVWDEHTIAQWEQQHHRFHEALVSGCQSALLIKFCEAARRVTDRFRRISIQRTMPDQKALEEHENIYKLTIERRCDEAVQALAKHIQRSSDRILEVADFT